jgi:hypothetical protein
VLPPRAFAAQSSPAQPSPAQQATPSPASHTQPSQATLSSASHSQPSQATPSPAKPCRAKSSQAKPRLASTVQSSPAKPSQAHNHHEQHSGAAAEHTDTNRETQGRYDGAAGCQHTPAAGVIITLHSVAHDHRLTSSPQSLSLHHHSAQCGSRSPPDVVTSVTVAPSSTGSS